MSVNLVNLACPWQTPPAMKYKHDGPVRRVTWQRQSAWVSVSERWHKAVIWVKKVRS